MQERKRFSYYAFISYKREDEKWAGWIQKQLETYRIPSIIRKQNLNVPKKIYPVFRDKTDLTGGKVLELLHKELEESQYLIVICSPHSASSQWVNKEVHHFIELGREDYIIPFIVDGEPFSQTGRECFPEALRKEVCSEVLGISVPELGKHQAFLRVVATLLNLKFDQLVMRDRRRKKRRRIMASAAALTAFFLLAGGIWYFMPHSAYYRSYVYVNEIPVGLNKLSRSERKHTAECFEIVTRQGKVIRVQRVNPAGKPVEALVSTFLDDAPVVEFYYEGDRVARAEFRNETGQIVLSKDYSSNMKAVDFLQADDSSQTMALAADQTNVMDSFSDSGMYEGKSEITRHINTYDENGYLVQVQFMRDNLNTPAKDSNGIYGRAYERDSEGRIIRMTYLDQNGNPKNSRLGVAGWAYEYDEEGKRINSYAFDLKGDRIRGEDGFALQELEYDGDGNVTECRYLDENGELCMTRKGYAREEMTYDRQGFLIKTCGFDTEGEPAFDTENGVHGYELEYDSQGYLCRMTSVGGDGSPTASGIGYCTAEYVMDQQGRPVKMRYFDAAGEPACHRQRGEYGADISYDAKGNITEVIFLNQEEIPALNREGYVRTRRQYDEMGRMIRESYEDQQGDLVRMKENVATYQIAYDRKGNIQEVCFEDETGSPCKNANGYARVVYEYDEAGNQISEAFFDERDIPVINSGGYASSRYEYDEQGNCTLRAYYNTEASLIKLKDGYAMEVMQYDASGNLKESSCYDENGEKVQCADGYYQLTYTYDSKGNCIQEEGYLSAACGIVQYTYNDDNLVIQEKYLKSDGSPGTDENGVFAYQYEYDAQGRWTKLMMLDSAGNPEDAMGYAAREYQYDENNNLIRTIDYGKDGVLSQELHTYDEKGDRVLTSHLDGAGNPLMTDDGAYVMRDYNDTGDVIRVSYYDTEGNPYLSHEGCASYVNTVDAMGNVTKVHYFGVDGNPTVAYGGYASGIREYNAQGWKIRDSFYGLDGKLIDNEGGSPSIIEYYYNDSGKEMMKIYYDSQGREVSRTSCLVQMIDIQNDSQAAQAGIVEGDFLIEHNTWNFFDYENAIDAVEEVKPVLADTSTEKELVIARKTKENAVVFFRVSMNDGPMGARLVDLTCTRNDWEYVKREYEAWLKEEEEK